MGIQLYFEHDPGAGAPASTYTAKTHIVSLLIREYISRGHCHETQGSKNTGTSVAQLVLILRRHPKGNIGAAAAVKGSAIDLWGA
jgi:hypothetical protein